MPDPQIVPEAKKHTRIVLGVRRLVKEIRTDWDVYMATYSAKPSYQLAEKQSGKEFWSIKGYAGKPSRETREKDPDAIIVHGDRIKFIIEVKYGALPSGLATDLDIDQDDLDKMVKLMAGPPICRVRGPVAAEGKKKGKDTLIGDFTADKDAKLILVSDFHLAKTAISDKFNRFHSLATSSKCPFQPADIETRVGDIPSLREILEANAGSRAT